MKKTFIKVSAGVCLMIAVIAGCKNATDSQNNKQTVSTDGSTSIEKVIGYLSEAYTENHPDVTVTYNPTGSGAGIQAVAEKRCDIGLSSRSLKDEEKADLKETVVAIDGIAVILNNENPVENITMEQLTAVYKGEITNWKEIGGEDAPIVLIGREAASGTRDGFEAITDTKDLCKYAQELTSTGDVVQTVSSNPNAIGYASLASVNDSVKAVKIEGTAPTIETVQNGTYKIQRSFIFVTRKADKLSDSAQAFFDFALSSQADDFIVKAGAVPVNR